MIYKALALLFVDVVIVLAGGVWLHGKDVALGHGAFWGLAGGLICALSAVGGAYWAEAKGKTVQQALAVVVVGMLFRMFFLGGWTILAVRIGEANALSFIGGFGAIYLVGQVLEVWMLTKLRQRQAAEAPSAHVEPHA